MDPQSKTVLGEISQCLDAQYEIVEKLAGKIDERYFS